MPESQEALAWHSLRKAVNKEMKRGPEGEQRPGWSPCGTGTCPDPPSSQWDGAMLPTERLADAGDRGGVGGSRGTQVSRFLSLVLSCCPERDHVVQREG